MQRVLKSLPIVGTLLSLLACANTQQEQTLSPTTVTIESEGWEIAGRMVAANGSHPTPVALLFHKAAGDGQEYAKLQEQLHKRGIASVAFDLRGHGRSTNLGSFDPNNKETSNLLNGTESDIIAAHKWAESNASFNSDRIGVVGASYSGEFAAVAGREYKYARAYVQFSPGSISDLTIDSIDKSAVSWLFIRGEIEFSFFDEIFDLIEEKSETAEVWVEPGKGHATNLLLLHPDLNERLADWLAANLN